MILQARSADLTPCVWQGWLRWTEGSRQAQSKAEELDQWQVAGATVGYFLPECARSPAAGNTCLADPDSEACRFSQRLRAFPDVFQFQERKQGGHTVTLSSSLSTPDERTQAVAGVWPVTQSLRTACSPEWGASAQVSLARCRRTAWSQAGGMSCESACLCS